MAITFGAMRRPGAQQRWGHLYPQQPAQQQVVQRPRQVFGGAPIAGAVSRPVETFGQQPVGPITTPLSAPTRAERGLPLNSSIGYAQGPFTMRPQSGFRGSAAIQYQRDDAGQAPVAGEADAIFGHYDNNRIAGSGPYDSGAGRARFGSAAYAPQPSYQAGVDERIAAYRQRGGLDPNRRTFGLSIRPGASDTPEMQQRRAAASIGYANEAAGLREGRRNRAINKLGLTHLAPTYQYTQDPAQPASSLTKQDSQLASRFTTQGEDGSASFDYTGFANGLFARYRDKPQLAAQKMLEMGATEDDFRAAIDAASSGFLRGGNPEFASWMTSAMESLGGQQQAQFGQPAPQPAPVNSAATPAPKVGNTTPISAGEFYGPLARRTGRFFFRPWD